ncbi:hypothetical protein GIB67_007269 [Kingdonia uniflora]|uniref:Uncharacterized protein n=1 Tax=Kingdonia uniflora TaxID=39325 RepID=A0A7J7NXV8_9MAGN|nr:hypothetical protein GIB67_007269 [Kingdonia uniflora]
MVSSSHLSLTNALLHHSQNAAVSQKLRNSHKNLSLFFSKRPITTCVLTKSTDIQRVVPLAASIAILLWSNPGLSNELELSISPWELEMCLKTRFYAEIFRNKQEIQDKYCLRGAEWGIGDCSTDGMTETEKEGFIAMLKKKMEPR